MLNKLWFISLTKLQWILLFEKDFWIICCSIKVKIYDSFVKNNNDGNATNFENLLPLLWIIQWYNYIWYKLVHRIIPLHRRFLCTNKGDPEDWWRSNRESPPIVMPLKVIHINKINRNFLGLRSLAFWVLTHWITQHTTNDES